MFYESNDHIASISKLTHECVTGVAPDVEASYVPHAVNSEFFAPRSMADRNSFERKFYPKKIKINLLCFGTIEMQDENNLVLCCGGGKSG